MKFALGSQKTKGKPQRAEIPATMADEERDMCPICKTDRYLSPNMKFLVNPECYHKICESCVDRIYSMGPAPCPYPNCEKILRKNKFKTQVFDDVEVEKEVDIRKRVVAVFNKTIDDFNGDLKEYNKYLEDVEDIIYNLDHDINVEETEEKLKTYEIQNKILIMSNQNKSAQDQEQQQQKAEFDKQMALKRRVLEKQIEEEDKANKEWLRKEIVNQLAADPDADPETVIAQVNRSVVLKKSAARRKLEELNKVIKNASFDKPAAAPIAKVAFTPFNGDYDLNKRYTVGEYDDPYLTKLKDDSEYIASGFKLELVYDRVLTEAFMGLGCFIQSQSPQLDSVHNAAG